MVKDSSSYRQIIKSTSIFGGVQFFNILIGLVRNKLLAILLGTTGIGLISTFQSVVDMIRSISSLGIETGGIRDISSNVDNPEKLGYTVSVFRWWVLLTASMGALICLLFCYPISIWVTGDGTYTVAIAFLSLAVFFTALSAGQTVIMQGMRRITYMAKSSIFANLTGLFVSLIFYWLLGIKGIIPAFISGGVINFFFARYFRRKTPVNYVSVNRNEAFAKGISNLKLGLFVLTASIINTTSMFGVKALINNEMDMQAVGIFQAAWTLTNVCLPLILKAMGSDFFPRLCAVSDNRKFVRRLVNEQTYIALVIAIPVVVVMILFSPYIISLLYTGEFSFASALLRWQLPGSFLKILSWPLAFILLAKGKGSYYLISEAVFFVVYIGCSYILFPSLGLVITGVAYWIAYIIYLAVVFIWVMKVVNFRWTPENVRLIVAGLVFIGMAALVIWYVDNFQLAVSILLSITALIYSYFKLNKVIDIKRLIHNTKR